MGKYLGSTGLTYLWGKIKSIFVTKTELAGHPTGRIYYGTCSTTANTYTKVATVDTFPLDEDDKPLVGTVVAIKYTVTNTYKTEGQTYALNVNNTGAYSMYYNNAAVATSTSANTLVAGYKNRHVFYVFNGTQWVWLSAGYDTNTTYSGMTQAEVDAGTGTTARLITPARLRDNFYTEGEVDTLLGSKANSNDLATVATSGSYNDLDDTPTIPTVPTNVSAFNNDAGYLTSYTETDPTVPAWAKQSTKPSYTAQEVGALPDSTTIPTKVSDLTNDSGFTSNTGTITGITMNGASKGTSGVVDLGTVLTEHQSLAGKQDVINDLATIRSGAALGATAVQTETDPVYSASAASGITSSNITSWNGKAEKIAEINHGTSNTTFALTPNIHHVWGEVTSLTLTLATGEAGVANEYMFRFYSGTTPTTLNLPSTVQWVQPLTCQQDKYYEVSIINNLAVYITSGMAAAESSGGTPEYATKDWVTNKIETEIDGGYYYV